MKKSCGQRKQKRNRCQEAQEQYSTLADIAASYISYNRPDIKDDLTYYKNSGSWTCAVERASKALQSDGKMHPHQSRIGYKKMAKTKTPLLALENIKFRSFEELHEAIRTALQEIPGISVLTIYDTALRLGAFLNILPQRVYLHAGTLTGAKKLNLNIQSETLGMSELPYEFQKLAAYEVEDCLCIYKDVFQSVTNR